MRNAYLRLEHETAKGYPLWAGLEDAPRTIHGVWRVEVKATEKFSAPPPTHIPSYPGLPLEKGFAATPRTDVPQVFLREVGAGRVGYFPWDIDRTFWEVLDVDHGKLRRNAVAWATNEAAPVTVTGPGVLDVAGWRQQHSPTVHLVNPTNPMTMKRPIRELIAVGEPRVRVRLPAGATVRGVRLLVGATVPATRRDGEWLEVTVPSIRDHEVVAVDWGSRTAVRQNWNRVAKRTS